MSYKKILHSAFVCLLFSFPAYSYEMVDLKIDLSEWKRMDMKSKFPHVFVISKEKPIYYQMGASKIGFVELLRLRENAEDANSSSSSWNKVKKCLKLQVC